jgi:hypothetical protein
VRVVSAGTPLVITLPPGTALSSLILRRPDTTPTAAPAQLPPAGGGGWLAGLSLGVASGVAVRGCALSERPPPAAGFAAAGVVCGPGGAAGGARARVVVGFPAWMSGGAVGRVAASVCAASANASQGGGVLEGARVWVQLPAA